MSKAWIAISLAPAALLVGCNSEPEPVSAVPPPAYAEPAPELPPVSINEGSSINSGPSVGDPGPTVAPEPLPPVPQQRTYTIRRGDTLWSIANREYGNGQRWRDIAQANPSIDPQRLAIGQEILLP